MSSRNEKGVHEQGPFVMQIRFARHAKVNCADLAEKKEAKPVEFSNLSETRADGLAKSGG